MYVIDAAHSQSDNQQACFYCNHKGHKWLQCKKLWNKLKQNGFVPRKATGKASGKYTQKASTSAKKKKYPDPKPSSDDEEHDQSN